MKKLRLNQETAGGFYAVHKGKPFYAGLVEFMSSGPCVPIALEKENAVSDFRSLIGATDPKDAAPGTIRKLYGDSKGERSEDHTSELQSPCNLVCRLLLEKKKKKPT